MNTEEYNMIQAEINELNNLIASTPEHLVIDRLGLESRKDELQQILDAHPVPERQSPGVKLTFQGKSVVGSKGIQAVFASDVLRAFTDVVAKVGASRVTQLGARGVIPEKDQYQLMICGTATGSFGFRITEVPSPRPYLPGLPSPVEQALEQTQRLLKATVDTDDALTEAVAEVDPRALDSLRKFFDILVNNETNMAFSFQDSHFKFKDISQLRQSSDRLRQDNLHIEEIPATGTFQGVLPLRRTFQFLIEGQNDPVIGHIGPEIDDPAIINQHIGVPVHVDLAKKVVGRGVPRYSLHGFRVLNNTEERPHDA